MKILVIAPHGDDEILGAGGALFKHSRGGDKVYRCIITEPYGPDWSEEYIANRQQEIKKSGKILKIEKTFLLGFPTVKLDTVPQKELNDRLAEIVNEVKPEIVYTAYSGDLNADHRLTFESTLVAARPVPKGSIKRILSYEVVSETEWGRNLKSFIPNFYIELNRVDLQKKLSALRAYGSEIKPYPHPRSLEVLETLAKLRGSEAGIKLAESFVLIREIKK